MNETIGRFTSWNPDLTLAAMWVRGRVVAARDEEDGGFSTVEMVIGIAIIIAILAAVAVILSDALTGKAAQVGGCITGANSTNNGGCA
ncbi:hypothetical protein [Kitasatospora sp. NPDC088134]|uniref:hypothetical protein n=1 Tax=Kitasatospora sp. NPDC088134 TaxID=3364071 RepID=UPI003807DE2E